MGRKPRIITVDGVTKSIGDWSRETGIPEATIRSRIDSMGWSPAEALRVPIEKKFSRIRKHRQVVRECPRLLKHKSDGRAYSTWIDQGEKRFRFFGRYGSAASKRKYKEWASEWIRCGGPPAETDLTWGELVEQYLRFADGYYRKNGKRTSQYGIVKTAVSHTLELFGDVPVDQLTVNDYRMMREGWIEYGYLRKTCNQFHNCVMLLLKWGVGQASDGASLVPVEMYQTWRTIERLKAGRTVAPESEPRQSVDWPTVETTLRHVQENRRETIGNLVRLHWLIGCRPGEICSMRGIDLRSVSDQVWKFTAEHAKTMHLGKMTMYAVGPKGIEILRSVGVVPGRGVDAIFGVNREQYAIAIRRACAVAGVEPWVPHQIRHSRATEIMRVYESNKLAAEGIGDTEEVTREVYIDRELSAAKIRIARELG